MSDVSGYAGGYRRVKKPKKAAVFNAAAQDSGKLKINREELIKGLTKAYREARKGKLKTEDEFKYDINWPRNTEILADDIINKTYKPSRGTAFIVKLPVIREIFAAPFRDRVVHHFVHNEVADWWDRHFIEYSFSCRKGKGTFYGIETLRKQIRSCSKNYTRKTYVIKMDISGYFMSLVRIKLLERVYWGLDQQFPRMCAKKVLLKFLWRQIIMDDPVIGVTKRPPLGLWKKLPAQKSLFNQPEGTGIVIGNLTSQLLSNIYLDQLDRFVTMTLGYKYYGRYVDDFYLVVTEEELPQAKRDILAIKKYLRTLGLTLHPHKTKIQEVKKGVEFLGVVIYPNHMVPGKRFKESFCRGAYECMIGLRSPDAIMSFLGHCSHCDGKKLCKEVFDKMGWEYEF